MVRSTKFNFPVVATMLVLLGLTSLVVVTASWRSYELHRDLASDLIMPFSAGALVERSDRALAAGDVNEADRFSRSALRLEPLNQRGIRVRAQVSDWRNDAAEAQQYYNLAGRLGWREPPTQAYWFDRAIQAGDLRVAVERLEAMRRLRWDNRGNSDRFLRLEASAAGRAALAARLAKDSSWAPLSTVDRLRGDQLDNRVLLLRLLAEQSAELDGAAADLIATSLFDVGRGRAARELWLRLRGHDPRRHPTIFDGNFQVEDNAGSSPFVWRVEGPPGVALNLVPAPSPLKGRALHIVGYSSTSALLLRQWIALQPGGYNLAWIEMNSPTLPLRSVLKCKGGEYLAMEFRNIGARHTARFEVPSSAGCSAQELSLVLPAGRTPGSETWLGDIRIMASGS